MEVRVNSVRARDRVIVKVDAMVRVHIWIRIRARPRAKVNKTYVTHDKNKRIRWKSIDTISQAKKTRNVKTREDMKIG